MKVVVRLWDVIMVAERTGSPGCEPGDGYDLYLFVSELNKVVIGMAADLEI